MSELFGNPEDRFSCEAAHFEPRHGKTKNVVYEQVRHTSGCTSTEDGKRLKILVLESRVNVPAV